MTDRHRTTQHRGTANSVQYCDSDGLMKDLVFVTPGHCLMVGTDGVPFLTNITAHMVPGRLALSTDPYSASDLTAKTEIIYVPCCGENLGLWNPSTSKWEFANFYDGIIADPPDHTPGAISTLLTKVVSNCTATTGNPAITLSASAMLDLCAGMEVTGTYIPGGTTVLSIDSTTQITLSANATGTGPTTLTFKVPANKNVDIFAYHSASNYRIALEKVIWTNDSTRASALGTVAYTGVLVKNADATRRYLGTIRTFATAGQTEISYGATAASGGSAPKCGVWNMYNRIRATFRSKEADDTWAYTTTAWRAKNNNVNNGFCFVLGRPANIRAKSSEYYYNTGSTSVAGMCGLGLDRSNAYDGLPGTNASFATSQLNGIMGAEYGGLLAEGYHYIVEVEYGGATGVFAGDFGAVAIYQSGALYDHEY